MKLIVVAAIVLAVAACDHLPYEPVPCHGNSPDSVWTDSSGTVHTLVTAHKCGWPRGGK